MYKITIKTRNSVYLLDKEAMTWERVITSAHSGNIPNEKAPLLQLPRIVVGERVALPDVDGLPIWTSRVVSFDVVIAPEKAAA